MEKNCRLKKKDETRNYLIKEINQNEMMSKKHKRGSYDFKLYETPS